jgi:hypothetical protein
MEGFKMAKPLISAKKAYELLDKIGTHGFNPYTMVGNVNSFSVKLQKDGELGVGGRYINQICFGGFNAVLGEEDRDAIALMIYPKDKQRNHNYHNGEINKYDWIGYLNYLMRESPYRKAFITKSADKVFNKYHGVMIKTDVPASLGFSALIAVRNAGECPKLLKHWTELNKRGVNRHLAFLAANFYGFNSSMTGYDVLDASMKFSGHGLFGNITNDAMIKFVLDGEVTPVRAVTLRTSLIVNQIFFTNGGSPVTYWERGDNYSLQDLLDSSITSCHPSVLNRNTLGAALASKVITEEGMDREVTFLSVFYNRLKEMRQHGQE